MMGSRGGTPSDDPIFKALGMRNTAAAPTAPVDGYASLGQGGFPSWPYGFAAAAQPHPSHYSAEVAYAMAASAPWLQSGLQFPPFPLPPPSALGPHHFYHAPQDGSLDCADASNLSRVAASPELDSAIASLLEKAPPVSDQWQPPLGRRQRLKLDAGSLAPSNEASAVASSHSRDNKVGPSTPTRQRPTAPPGFGCDVATPEKTVAPSVLDSDNAGEYILQLLKTEREAAEDSLAAPPGLAPPPSLPQQQANATPLRI